MKREIPKKNYIILIAMTVIVVLLVLYLTNLYKNNNFNKNNSIMSDYLVNVTIQELDNYLLENPDVLIYFADSQDLSNSKFEKQFKKYLIKNDLQKKFLFVDSQNISMEDREKFLKKYLSEDLKNKKVILNIIPNILFVEEGQIVDILYSYKQKMNIDYLKEKIISYGVME